MSSVVAIASDVPVERECKDDFAIYQKTEHSKEKAELCAFCAEKCTEDWYKCETCSSAEDSKELEEVIYCDGCIQGFHIKKGHKVTDKESRKPLVCTLHKQLFSMFCSTCDVLICLKCLISHVNHTIIAIQVKAKQVQSDIFKELSKLEQQENRTRALKENMMKLTDERANEASKLIEEVKSQMKNVKNSEYLFKVS